MFPLFRILLSTQLGVLLASNIVLVSGAGPSGRYDILYGSQGEDACTLQNNIVANGKCTTSTRRDSYILNRNDAISPAPSKCTCNEIFFNIWSACSYSTGNNTLPNYAQWTQRCATNSINVESSAGFSKSQGNMGIDVPSWAKIPVPGNTTFDLQRAVTLTFSEARSNRWTTLQITLPVVAAIMTLFISGVVLLIFQRYNYQRKLSRGGSHMGWPKGLRRLHLHTSHAVTTTIDRDESWEIDGPIPKQPFEDVHGQPIPKRPSLSDPEPTDVHEYSKTFTSSNSVTEKDPTGTHSFRSSVRLPWKRRPPHIKLVPATSRFRVDDAKSIFTCSGEAAETRNERNGAQELVDDFDHTSGDDETTSLITASERATQEVILISRSGRDFTLESRSENTVSVNSHIKIISPSVSSESRHSTMQPVSARHTLYMPIPPPPPSHAAPAPPVMPRSLRPIEHPKGSNREQSLTYFQPPFLSTIREASPTHSYSSSNTSLHRSAALRRSSNPESISSTHINSNPSTSTASPPSYFNPHRSASPSSNHSLALESEEDDFYMEVAATNGHDRSDVSSASFYYNSPVQGPVPRHPVRMISLYPINDPAAFFPGPVRGAGYSGRTYTQ